MTVTDQIKIIDNKIKANQGQYDLDRLTAKISTLSSDELRKYEYLIEQTKFDYSSLGKVFNKGLDDKNDKKRRTSEETKKHWKKNQKVNNNDKNKKANDKSERSSVQSESS